MSNIIILLYQFKENIEMRNNLVKKYLVFGIMILMLGLSFGSAVDAIRIIKNNDEGKFISVSSDGYIDITVQEAWNLLNNLSNGIQIPIDVRTDGEWRGERIDTPYPENPIHYPLSDLQNENGLQEFMSRYSSNDVIVYCKSGTRSSSAANILASNEFNGTIYNMLGGITSWRNSYPTKLGNEPPYQPEDPSGPSIGITEFSYQFSTSATDPDDDTIRYGWDWNEDDIVDDWTDYYPSSTSVNIYHSWNVAGTYVVRVISEDNVGDQSDFSSALTVIIVVNIPPNAPDIIGPANGKAGEEREYTFVTTDPNEDDVSYYVEWGDESLEDWSESFKSSENFTVGHIWNEKGNYTIRVKAKDIHNAESEWSTFEVSMPKDKQHTNMFFLRYFLDHQSIIFPILRHLLEL